MIDENKDGLVQLIGFYVGNKIFGADIMSVQEILRDPTIDSIDDCPDFVTGVIRLRGQVVPALDLRNRMGNGSDPDTDQQNWVLIAQLGDQRVGFVADSVTRIMRINAGSILPAPQIALSGATSPHIQGICESEFGMLVVLDLKRLLSSDEVEAIKTMNTKLEQI
ncbi:MAG: chemotaxis protein CheW [Desulfobacteraceae bacterium]